MTLTRLLIVAPLSLVTGWAAPCFAQPETVTFHFDETYQSVFFQRQWSTCYCADGVNICSPHTITVDGVDRTADIQVGEVVLSADAGLQVHLIANGWGCMYIGDDGFTAGPDQARQRWIDFDFGVRTYMCGGEPIPGFDAEWMRGALCEVSWPVPGGSLTFTLTRRGLKDTDFNSDGAVDVRDVLEFVTQYNLSSRRAHWTEPSHTTRTGMANFLREWWAARDSLAQTDGRSLVVFAPMTQSDWPWWLGGSTAIIDGTRVFADGATALRWANPPDNTARVGLNDLGLQWVSDIVVPIDYAYTPVFEVIPPGMEWLATAEAYHVGCGQTFLVAFAAPLRADFDGNGTVAVPDVFAFLGAWFAADLRCDWTGDAAVGVPDIFAFLTDWFAAE